MNPTLFRALEESSQYEIERRTKKYSPQTKKEEPVEIIRVQEQETVFKKPVLKRQTIFKKQITPKKKASICAL